MQANVPAFGAVPTPRRERQNNVMTIITHRRTGVAMRPDRNEHTRLGFRHSVA